jgi:hypothetical protein
MRGISLRAVLARCFTGLALAAVICLVKASFAEAESLPTVRMRAGSKEAFKDSQGNEWLGDATTKDGGFEGGTLVDRAADLAIENTKDPDLYRHEHWGMTGFNYKLPTGKYVVKLHFAETFERNTGPEQRVFSFKVQDKEFKDFDVFKKAGWAKKAYVETVPVEVTDGKLTITFTPKVNYPEINGIEIIPADKAGAAVASMDEKAGGAKGTSDALPTVRMRAGSTKPYKDSQGNQWLGDEPTKDGGFEGGDLAEREADMKIANTKDPELYRFEHWGMDGFNYKLPNGKYMVKLHFAETWQGIDGPGGRVFTFKIQDKEFKDFDVWTKAGDHQRAYIESVPVEIKDGKLTITFTAQEDNPQINGIEIIPADKAGAAVASMDEKTAGGAKGTSDALPTVRMRAGSTKPYKDSQGNQWMADEPTKDGGFEGGDLAEREADMKIANTKDPDLYRFEHWGMDGFNYKLPNGKYVVKLHFAETWQGIDGPGGRVFAMKVQEKEFPEFDVWKKAGDHQRAYIESVPVEIKDGKLTITFTAQADNPEINAIEILPAK